MSVPTGRSRRLNEPAPNEGVDEPGRRGWLGALAVLLALTAAMFLALYQFVSPAAVPADAPATEFSAGRAMSHLEVIAREPHPVGTPENARVRGYLVQEISSLGLEPEVQRKTVFASEPDNAGAATVENVLARVEGTDPGRSVLVTAHYDSVPTSPGAGDNGMAVAAMLETLRALRHGPAPRNDLVFLFNDGEEPGMYGSTAFVEEHPWAEDVAVAFDFDRDAPTGASMLLWTADRDGWLVREMSEASPGILASSVVNSAKRKDFNNDLHALAAAGMTGAHLDGVSGQDRYHTLRDDLGATDPRSLQAVGDAMLALSRHFGGLSIGETEAEDRVFFTLFGSGILHYPAAWTLPLALLAGLGIAGAISYGLWRGRLDARRLAGAMLVLALGALTAAGAALLANRIILAAHPESLVFGERDFYGQGFYTGALYAFTAALALALWSRLGHRLGASYLAVAALGLSAALAVLMAVVLPDRGYLAAWPALAGALALAVFLLLPEGGGWRAWAREAALLVPALVAIGFLVPVLYAGTIDGPEAGLADRAALLVLLLALVAPQLSLVAKAFGRRWMPAAATLFAALVGVGLLLAGNAASGYDAERPRPNTLFYALDSDAGTARWATLDAEPDGWTGRFLGDDPQERTVGGLFGGGDPTPVITSPAPVASLEPPSLVLLEQETDGATRTLRLHLASNRGAWRAVLLPGPGVEVLGWGVNDEPLREAEDQVFVHTALPAEGVDLTVKARSPGPARFTVIDQTNGLPRIPGVRLPERPETVMPAPLPGDASFFTGYPTFVSRSFVPGGGGREDAGQPGTHPRSGGRSGG